MSENSPTLFRYAHVAGDPDPMPEPRASRPDRVTWDDRKVAPFCSSLSGYDPLRVQNAAARGRRW